MQDHIHAHYRALIEAAPFAVLATHGPDGLDVSPRGDAPGFIRDVDEHVLELPERPGNNRVDSLLNVLVEPSVSLLFLIPGVNETLRVRGRATIHADDQTLDAHRVNGKRPRCVVRITVTAVYFQCARALLRSRLWDPASLRKRTDFPSTGTMLEAFAGDAIRATAYDRDLPSRQAATLY